MIYECFSRLFIRCLSKSASLWLGQRVSCGNVHVSVAVGTIGAGVFSQLSASTELRYLEARSADYTISGHGVLHLKLKPWQTPFLSGPGQIATQGAQW